MFRYVCKHHKKETVYSQKFETKRKAMKWYRNYGLELSKKFKRTLELVEK